MFELFLEEIKQNIQFHKQINKTKPFFFQNISFKYFIYEET